jgi:hypothetical protein
MTTQTTRRFVGRLSALRVADGLSLAAAPSFALMALVSGVSGGPMDMMCSAMPGALPLSGMTWMYLLMSIFHSGPWLKRALHPKPRRDRDTQATALDRAAAG